MMAEKLDLASPQTLNVAVLGGAAVDWVAQVNSLPRKDSIVLAHSYERFAGGSAANVAVGLARLGCRTGFIGKLGDDEYGRWLLQAFADEAVHTEALLVEHGCTSASCNIAVDDQGERMIVAIPGASLLEDVRELDVAYLRRARTLYVGPAYPEVAATAMDALHEGGGTVFYAPSGAWGLDGLAGIRVLVDKADVLLVSRAEAEALLGPHSPADAVKALQGAGASVVIETLGREGALVLAQGRLTPVPAFSVSDVRDTTGAGDAFAAGLVAGFLEGLDWPAAARMGCAVAALKIRHVGARSGLPKREEVQHFLAAVLPREAMELK
jgi:ribokinase